MQCVDFLLLNLRASHSSLDKKFHVEHFTCSLCPTLFGPQDSYYEHDGDVYCHFHYSTRFATKCAGCNSAILKQFVEINRNSRDECWHPECYMINKVRLTVDGYSMTSDCTSVLERQSSLASAHILRIIHRLARRPLPPLPDTHVFPGRRICGKPVNAS